MTTFQSLCARGLAFLGRNLLRLRYRAELRGLKEIAARGRNGILFLPNHPALIDPVILICALQPLFAPRALANRDQVNRPFIRWAARRFRVWTMPDALLGGETAREEIASALASCADWLRRGGNVLLYPAGHISRAREEQVGGTSAVETILRAAPNARVVLVRTRGLWGSGFSRASGQAPKVARTLLRGIKGLLASGIFFAPKRAVSIEFQEPADFPRHASRDLVNRALEGFYNRDPAPNIYVPCSIWERRGAEVRPEPSASSGRQDATGVSSAIRETVLGRLRGITGNMTLRDADHLAKDLGMDSLAIVELAAWLESEFGTQFGDSGAGMETVADVLWAAAGAGTGRADIELKPVPLLWHNLPTDHPVALPDGGNVPEVFLRCALGRPHRVMAADQASGVRTYRDALAAILALKPVMEDIPGPYVGIMLPSSVAAGLIILAVQFAGKTPVMVNWTLGLQAMRHTLDLLDVGRVLTSARLVERLEKQWGSMDEIRMRLVFLEEVRRALPLHRRIAAAIQARTGAGPLWRARVADTAVVLFTSGSEAAPKAVPLTHANLLANMRDLVRVLHIKPGDRMLGMLPPFHSFGITGTILFPFCTGIPVAYHPNPTEGALLARTIEAYRLTIVVGTPTFLNGILRAARPGDLSSVRLIVSGAEKCPDALHETVRKSYPHCRIVEGYGVTECSPVVAVNDDRDPRPGTIGRVLPSFRYAVVHPETGARVRQGEMGRLLVRGPAVFSGYLHHAGRQPFMQLDGLDWYDTGDLVRESSDGLLTFCGRLKRFVKVGGEMISLPAIEEALLRSLATPTDEGPCLAVESTGVEPNPDIVLFTTRPLARDAVNRLLREAGLSPLHHVRVVRQLPELPTLGTGKVDYRALKRLLETPAT